MDIKKVLLVKSVGELLVITACLSHNDKRKAINIQEDGIKMCTNLPYVEGTSDKLPGIFRSYKIRATFYIENTLRKVLCKPKD